jgi:hypothetical protein
MNVKAIEVDFCCRGGEDVRLAQEGANRQVLARFRDMGVKQSSSLGANSDHIAGCSQEAMTI